MTGTVFWVETVVWRECDDSEENITIFRTEKSKLRKIPAASRAPVEDTGDIFL